jgi:peptidyl-prolyl cis-trans isomerase SDCCAG10
VGASRKLNLLSFGEEAEEEEQVLATVKEKLKSSHDVLNDPRLLKDSSNHAEMVLLLWNLEIGSSRSLLEDS